MVAVVVVVVVVVVLVAAAVTVYPPIELHAGRGTRLVAIE